MLLLGKIFSVILLLLILGRWWWTVLVVIGLWFVIRLVADVYWWGDDNGKW